MLDEHVETWDEFQQQIDNLMKQRDTWWDEHAEDMHEFNIGDIVVDVTDGRRYRVEEFYRLAEDFINPDARLQRLELGPGGEWVPTQHFDNTSRHGAIHPYVLVEDYENETKKYVSKLKLVAGR